VLHTKLISCRAGALARPPNEVLRRLLIRSAKAGGFCWLLAGDGRLETVSATTVSVPSGLDFVTTLLPGTYVPGFTCVAARGWRNGAVHFFCASRGATHDSPRPSKPSELRLVHTSI